MAPRLFFFYGTLQAGAGNRPMAALLGRLREVGAAQCRGSMFAIRDARGWYPVFIPGEGVILGTVYASSPMFSGRDLAALDRFEGFDPASPGTSRYLREPVRVVGQDGRRLTAEAYRFNRRVPPATVALDNGDFLGWIARTGKQAFGSAS